MGSVVDGVKTVNSAVRTILLAALVGVVGYTGFLVYSEYTKQDRLLQSKDADLSEAREKLVSLEGELKTKSEEIGVLQVDVKQKAQHIERLETSIHLLKTDQRLAQLSVVEMERDDQGKAVNSTLEFTELSPTGTVISEPKRFTLPGDIVYVDNWIVKFDDKYIENGDIQRGTSLCLFRRVFSEDQIPTEGYSLDEVGMRPQAYSRGGSMTEFEQELWSDFWEIANDREKAEAMGIRAANGEAVSIKVREGQNYSVSLRASGGLSIEPVEDGKALSAQ